MKKYMWMVALLIALSLALIGCPTGGGGNGGDPPETGDGPPVISLPAFELTLADNFQYGEGYQGLVQNANLFPGGKITEGDVYTLKITFTLSRDLEDVMTVGLVDTTPEPEGDYWIPLSYDADDEGWELEDDDAPAIAATVEESSDGAEVTKVITFTALKTALSDKAIANTIAFETQGDGTKGSAGSGVKGVVKISFTEFLFVKGTAEDLEGSEPVAPPEPPELQLKKTILGETADWQNLDTDGPANDGGLSLKGNISEATTNAILAFTDGEARIYWKYVGANENGTSANNGIGNFAGVAYNAGAGGLSGVAKIPVSDFDLDSQPSYVPDGLIYLNVYNDCAVEKIEIWAP
jgi:hypothetical protein